MRLRGRKRFIGRLFLRRGLKAIYGAAKRKQSYLYRRYRKYGRR